MATTATPVLRSPDPPAIEVVRSYWDSRPCNLRHSPKLTGTKEYFDEVEQRKYFVEPHIPGFAQFERWADKDVLEIGCGMGTDAVNFARAGARYTGADLSSVSLDLARKRFEVYGLKRTLIEANAEALDQHLPASSFDLIYSFGVIHHTPNQRGVVESARQLIRATGELRIMLYAKNSWKDIMIEEGFDQPEAQSGCPLATTYTEDMVRELFKDLFEPVEMRQAHIFPFVIEKYVNYEYELLPWFKAMPPAMFAALERRLGWHLLITAKPI